MVLLAVSSLISIIAHAGSYEWEPLKTTVVAPEDKCLTYDVKYEQTTLMQVKTINKVYFQTEAKTCPNSGECKFRKKAYLVEGDHVFVSAEKAGFRCAYYGTSKGSIIAGFLPAYSLIDVKDDRVQMTENFLKGKWISEVSDLNFIAGRMGSLHLSGHAQWADGSNIHEGEISADAKVDGNVVFFREGPDEESDCTVRVARRGPYLILSDNGVCGGVNVRFSGIYIKSKK